MNVPEVLKEQAERLEQYYQRYYPAAAAMAKPCFLNTAETTLNWLEDGTCFVITGDIPAMWLRDSAAQVRLYARFAADSEELRKIIRGVIAEQAKLVLIDPYANAFNREELNPNPGHVDDDTVMNGHIWERKYEVDSLCAPLELTWVYCGASGDYSVLTENWVKMAQQIVSVFRTEQDHSRSPYWFRRKNCPAHDTLPGDGHGTPVKVTGMTWSGFRPSDDSCIYGYLIPSNMMAVCALQHMQILLGHISGQESLAKEAGALAQEIRKGIEEYGVTEKTGYGKIYAYETDGLGHWNLMDDANVPNLLSIPYLGYAKVDDPLYQNTRRFLLSKDNPYYFSGRYGSGEGSPHTLKNYIWPIGVVMQAMTSVDSNEILNCLSILTHTDAGTGFMHESFDVEDPRHFSRDWFAWANTLFAELLEDLMESHFFEKRKV